MTDKRFAAELMHQQCWCWGRDVAANENLLLRFGFDRHRAPACPGATRYEWMLPDATRIALWGFGMFIEVDGEIGYFGRYRRGVWLLPRGFDVSPIHNDEQVKAHLRRPTSRGDRADALRLASSATRWCEAYERWVIDQAGPDHRAATLKKWEHPLVDASEMPAAWRRARAIYERWYQPGDKDDAIANLLAYERGPRRHAFENIAPSQLSCESSALRMSIPPMVSKVLGMATIRRAGNGRFDGILVH